MNFADRLTEKIKTHNSVICAGYDPRPETFPKFILEEAQAKSSDNEDLMYHALLGFYERATRMLKDKIAITKPNLAFFEQYGIAGMRAFQSICSVAKEHDVLVLADGKRGDIGSTAKAYSAAFLGRSKVLDTASPVFDVDALTVNPFLGFDTLEPFLSDCVEYGKGIFILVKTSNPGSAAIQNQVTDGEKTISIRLAEWLAENASVLTGDSGLSGLGAVVGATYPDEAKALREVMPNNYFLIPGMGSQGGQAKDATAGFRPDGTGALINLSRGLFSSFSSTEISEEEMERELHAKVDEACQTIQSALED